jgi:hypothetical protein
MRTIRQTNCAALIIGTLVVFGFAPPALAGSIIARFDAVDLPDLTPAEDLWQYTYAISGRTFEVDQGFSIYFDPARYGLILDPPGVNADWDVIAVQPDPALPADGFYDALALASGASLDDPFVVAFVWLGGAGAVPGSQPLTVNQFDPFGELSFLEFGRTVRATSSVPSPPLLMLICIGLVSLSGRLRQRHTR